MVNKTANVDTLRNFYQIHQRSTEKTVELFWRTSLYTMNNVLCAKSYFTVFFQLIFFAMFTLTQAIYAMFLGELYEMLDKVELPI